MAENRTMSPDFREIYMADYAVIRGAEGAVSGLWLANPALALDRPFLLAMLERVDATEEVIEQVKSGDYRTVSNTFDGRGGGFVMFGGAQAPHEARITGTGKKFPDLKKKVGCFIATACYGSEDCAEVLHLRRFRDTRLLPSRAGTVAVRIYYLLSPPIARWLARSPAACRAVRKRVLDPIVRRISRS